METRPPGHGWGPGHPASGAGPGPRAGPPAHPSRWGRPAQKLDCSRVTRSGHVPSSRFSAGADGPESHARSQGAGPPPRPLPLREKPAEPELATGDLAGGGPGGVGSEGAGGAAGSGSPRESKFPPIIILCHCDASEARAWERLRTRSRGPSDGGRDGAAFLGLGKRRLGERVRRDSGARAAFWEL